MAKKPIHDLTRAEFYALRDMGLLWEVYPDAPDNYDALLDEKTKNQIKLTLRDDEQTRELIKKYRPKTWGTTPLEESMAMVYGTFLKKLGLNEINCPWMEDNKKIEIEVVIRVPLTIRRIQ